MKKHKIIWTVSVAFLVALAGCGGGGGTSGGQNPPVETAQSTISIDNSVPSSTTQKVAEVLSPFGSAPVGAELPISMTTSNAENLVIAIDADNNVLLAALANSSATVLSADSTALAFVRIALQALPQGLTPSQLYGNIRATAEYPNLVSLITQMIGSGSTPLTPAILSSLTTVVMQSQSAIAQQVPAAAAQRSKAAIASPVTTPLPYKINSFTYLAAVSVTDGSDLQHIDLINTWQVDWSANSTDLNGNALSENVLLPRDALISFAPAPVLVASNGVATYLSVQQTDATRTTNVAQTLTDVLTVGLNLFSQNSTSNLTKCISAGVGYLTSSASFANLIGSPTGQNLNAYLTNTFTFSALAGLANAFRNANDCTGTAIAKAAATGLAKWLSGFVAIFNTISLAKQTAELGYTAAETVYTFNNPPINNLVCQAPDGEIADCVATLTISPSPATIAVGLPLPLTVTANAADGQPTAVPSDLLYYAATPEDNLIAIVDPSDDIDCIKSGKAKISVADPATQATQSVVVDCTSTLAITPSPATVAIGSTIALAVTAKDENGNSIPIPMGLVWDSSNKPVASVDSMGNVTGLTGGTTTITVTDPVTGDTAGDVITVLSATCSAFEPGPGWDGVCAIPSITATSAGNDLKVGTSVSWSDLVKIDAGSCGVTGVGILYDSVTTETNSYIVSAADGSGPPAGYYQGDPEVPSTRSLSAVLLLPLTAGVINVSGIFERSDSLAAQFQGAVSANYFDCTFYAH